VVAKVRDRITVSKRITQVFDMEKFDYEESKRCGNKCRTKITDLQREDLNDNGIAGGAYESIQHNMELKPTVVWLLWTEAA
jgi:hypothetical protein